jgi:hypothetical protein
LQTKILFPAVNKNKKQNKKRGYDATDFRSEDDRLFSGVRQLRDNCKPQFALEQ